MLPLAVCASALSSAIILVLSAADGDAVTGFISAVLLLTSVLLLVESRRYEVPGRVPYVAALTCLVGGLLLMHVLNWSDGCGIGRTAYSHIEGLVAWCMTFPTAYMVLALIADVFDARFNRILVAGFSMFVSIGIMTLAWVFISVFCYGDLDVRYVSSQEMAYLFVNLVASVAAAVLIARLLKGKGFRVERREVSQ